MIVWYYGCEEARGTLAMRSNTVIEKIGYGSFQASVQTVIQCQRIGSRKYAKGADGDLSLRGRDVEDVIDDGDWDRNVPQCVVNRRYV